MGGREKNKHSSKKLHAGRGTVGKTAVAGAKAPSQGGCGHEPRDTTAVLERTQAGATVFMTITVYRGLPGGARAVSHGAEYRGMAHTNGRWSSKRGWARTTRSVRTYRYVDEFSGRHNMRARHEIRASVAAGMAGKRLSYEAR